jgi:predicted ATPase
MPTQIKSVSIRGFKSIENLDNFEPGRINLLIGPNGAGKSNFISFFRMLSWAANSSGQFQRHLNDMGGAGKVLFDGPAMTRDIVARIGIENEKGLNEYALHLAFKPEDTLVFWEEKLRFSSNQRDTKAETWHVLTDSASGGRSESNITTSSNKTAFVMLRLLSRVVVYQFHDTTSRAAIRGAWATDDGRWLKENAANLGSFLYRLSQQHPAHYRRIIHILSDLLPFFENFDLYDEQGRVTLRWREHDSQQVFSATQASDGMIRLVALVALLAQPPEDLPDVVFIDEPELGLHPAALQVLGGLIRKASHRTQFFISTQSENLINEFDPEQVIVVERNDRTSVFQRLDPQELAVWLEDYTLGQLVSQNVMGGRQPW